MFTDVKICEVMLPTITESYVDANAQYKAGTVVALCDMAKVVGPQLTTLKIYPNLLELLKDDNSEVKINVVNGIIKIA